MVRGVDLGAAGTEAGATAGEGGAWAGAGELAWVCTVGAVWTAILVTGEVLPAGAPSRSGGPLTLPDGV